MYFAVHASNKMVPFYNYLLIPTAHTYLHSAAHSPNVATHAFMHASEITAKFRRPATV